MILWVCQRHPQIVGCSQTEQGKCQYQLLYQQHVSKCDVQQQSEGAETLPTGSSLLSSSSWLTEIIQNKTTRLQYDYEISYPLLLPPAVYHRTRVHRQSILNKPLEIHHSWKILGLSTEKVFSPWKPFSWHRRGQLTGDCPPDHRHRDHEIPQQCSPPV